MAMRQGQVTMSSAAKVAAHRRLLQRQHQRLKLLRDGDELGQKPDVDVGAAAIFRKVARAMAFGKHAILCARHARGFAEHLKHDGPVFRAITLSPERGERERVCSVVSEIEAALGRQAFVSRIGKASAGGGDQAFEFSLGKRLDLQVSDPGQVGEIVAHRSNPLPSRR